MRPVYLCACRVGEAIDEPRYHLDITCHPEEAALSSDGSPHSFMSFAALYQALVCADPNFFDAQGATDFAIEVATLGRIYCREVTPAFARALGFDPDSLS